MGRGGISSSLPHDRQLRLFLPRSTSLFTSYSSLTAMLILFTAFWKDSKSLAMAITFVSRVLILNSWLDRSFDTYSALALPWMRLLRSSTLMAFFISISFYS
jgi:hypothetical protein